MSMHCWKTYRRDREAPDYPHVRIAGVFSTTGKSREKGENIMPKIKPITPKDTDAKERFAMKIIE